MTTPTPTSELTASPFDVAGLAQLANAFFASLPGQTPPVAAVQPAAPASVTPAAAPATPDDAPAPPAELADFGRAGVASYAAPVGFGAGLPDVPAGGPRPHSDSAGAIRPPRSDWARSAAQARRSRRR